MKPHNLKVGQKWVVVNPYGSGQIAHGSYFIVKDVGKDSYEIQWFKPDGSSYHGYSSDDLIERSFYDEWVNDYRLDEMFNIRQILERY